MENFNINSPIEISGLDNDKPYIELTSRLCWLDFKNLNGIGISSKAIESLESLKDMPVVAKINTTGTKFGSHEVAIDDNGNVIFNTSAYGVHTDIWVADEEVNIPKFGTKKLPCLYAKAKIWKRFANVVELIKNKFISPDEYNGGLWSSWELQGSEYHIDNFGGKIYDKFSFLSNCLIDVPPAYSDTSKGVQIASESTFINELEIAYINDIEDINNKNNEGGKKIMKNKVCSALSTRDLMQKCSEALNPKGWNSTPYFCVWEVYPLENKILAFDVDRSIEDEYKIINFSVENDIVTIGEITDTKLSKVLSEMTNVNIQVNLDDTAKLLSSKESQINELEIKIAELEGKVTELSTDSASKADALIKSSEEIEKLKSEVSSLVPFKEKVEEIERVEAERILSEKRDSLKKYALKGGFISETELSENEEIAQAIESVDETKIKLLIAERIIKKLDEKSETETSEFKQNPLEEKTELANANINLDDEDSFNPLNIMSSFLKR